MEHSKEKKRLRYVFINSYRLVRIIVTLGLCNLVAGATLVSSVLELIMMFLSGILKRLLNLLRAIHQWFCRLQIIQVVEKNNNRWIKVQVFGYTMLLGNRR